MQMRDLTEEARFEEAKARKRQIEEEALGAARDAAVLEVDIQEATVRINELEAKALNARQALEVAKSALEVERWTLLSEQEALRSTKNTNAVMTASTADARTAQFEAYLANLMGQNTPYSTCWKRFKQAEQSVRTISMEMENQERIIRAMRAVAELKGNRLNLYAAILK